MNSTERSTQPTTAAQVRQLSKEMQNSLEQAIFQRTATCFSRSLRILLRCGSVEADSDVKEVWGTPTNASAPEGPFGAMTTPAPEGLSDMVKSALGLHSDQFRSTDSQQCVREFGIGILRA